MKMLKILVAGIMVLGILFGCAGSLAEMPGIWVCVPEFDDCEDVITSLWQYTFMEDGSYEYVDQAIGYQEQGTYAVTGTRLILTRSDGGTEEYELTGEEWIFRGIDEDTELVFARENPHSLLASAGPQ